MNLDFENIDQLFENSLDGLELKPSTQVKTQIQKKMFWHNAFVNVSVRISLVLFLLLTITGSFLWFNNSKNELNTDAVLINNKTVRVEISIEKHAIDEGKEVFDSPKVVTTKDNSRTPEKPTIELSDKSNINNVSKEINNHRNTNSTLIAVTKQVDNKKYDYKNFIESNKNMDTKIVAAQVMSTNFIQDKKSSKSELLTETAPSIRKPVLIPPNFQSTEKSENITISLLKARENKGLWNISYPNLNNFPLRADTVGINIWGEKIIFPSNRWNLGVYIRPNYSISRFNNASSPESQAVSDLNAEAYNPAYSYGFGLELSYQFKQIALGGGLAYGQYTQDFNTLEESLQTQNIDFWNYTDVENWNVSTSTYLNLDSLLQGDTVMTVITDSTMYLTQDSTLSSRIDSAWTEKAFTYKNSYQYFEIPLFVDYTFNRFKKWQPFMRVGLVTGIHIKSKAYYLNANGKIIDASTMPFVKFNFWVDAGLGLKYNLNKKLLVYISTSYRYNLNAIVQEKQLFNQYLDNWGISTGLQYHF